MVVTTLLDVINMPKKKTVLHKDSLAVDQMKDIK